MSRAFRGTFDFLEHWVVEVAPARPRAAMAAAFALGSLRNRISRRWPSPREVQAIFPGLARRTAAAVAWRIGGFAARNRVVAEWLASGRTGAVRALLRPPGADLTGLRPPLLLGTFHLGAVFALGAALGDLPGRVVAVRRGRPYTPAPPVEVLTTRADGQGRAAVFQRMLAAIEEGGFVVAPLDVPPGPRHTVPCLGRTLTLARGPLALARLTGVPLVPLAARWRGREIAVECGPALTAGGSDPERALAEALAAWLEADLSAAPEGMGLALVRNLLGELVSEGPAGS